MGKCPSPPATELRNSGAGLVLPIPASTSLDDDINPAASAAHQHQLQRKDLKINPLRGGNIVLKDKLQKLMSATEPRNSGACLQPSTPVSTPASAAYHIFFTHVWNLMNRPN